MTVNRENGSDEKQRFLTPEDFRILVDSLWTENLIHQDTEGVKRIKKALKERVPQEETNIYGIELWQEGSSENTGQNFMVYDKRTRTLNAGAFVITIIIGLYEFNKNVWQT